MSTTTRPARKTSRKAATPKPDRYADLVERFIAAIEQGVANPDGWSAPWHMLVGRRPRNAKTGKGYSALNRMILTSAALTFEGPAVWATYRQWEGLGCQVQRGETGTHIWTAFRKDVERTKGDGTKVVEEQVRFSTKALFHVSQVADAEGRDGARDRVLARHAEPVRTEVERNEAAEVFLSDAAGRMGVGVRWGHEGAAYSPRLDVVTMPAREAFTSADSLYSTWAHELTHATGHGSRLGRDGIVTFDRFGSERYAFEELVAELGAAFVCAELGMVNEARTDHADYLAHWLRALKADPTALRRAATQAEAAVAFLGVNDLLTVEPADDEAEADEDGAELVAAAA